MLSICPILSAAPRTLQSVLTILSALASDSKGESSRAFMSAKQTSVKKHSESFFFFTVRLTMIPFVDHLNVAVCHSVSLTSYMTGADKYRPGVGIDKI